MTAVRMPCSICNAEEVLQGVEFDLPPHPGCNLGVKFSGNYMFFGGFARGGYFRGQRSLSLAGQRARAPEGQEYREAFRARARSQRAGKWSHCRKRNKTGTTVNLWPASFISDRPIQQSAGSRHLLKAKSVLAPGLKVEFDESSKSRRAATPGCMRTGCAIT